MKIYTRMGDGGETSLPGGRRLSKDDTIFNCLGALDETNAVLGLATSYVVYDIKDKRLAQQLYDIQSNLLSIGACLASDEPAGAKILVKLDDETNMLESQIDQWDKKLPVLKNFILPGGTMAASALHQTRTTIRRAERLYHSIPSKSEKLIVLGRYLNRLSDYFFQAARYVNHTAGNKDQIWNY